MCVCARRARTRARSAGGAPEPWREQLVAARHVGAERPEGEPVFAGFARLADDDLFGEPDAGVGKIVVFLVGEAACTAKDAVDNDIIGICGADVVRTHTDTRGVHGRQQ